LILDPPPAARPVATLRPRDPGARLVVDMRRCFMSWWGWLRPRANPVTVAFAGLLGVLAATCYLRELAHRPPEHLPAAVLATSTSHAGDAMGRIRVVAIPGGGTAVARPRTAATITSPRNEVVVLKIEPGVYRIQIEHVAPAPASR
jgi:hypothetical protein